MTLLVTAAVCVFVTEFVTVFVGACRRPITAERAEGTEVKRMASLRMERLTCMMTDQVTDDI